MEAIPPGSRDRASATTVAIVLAAAILVTGGVAFALSTDDEPPETTQAIASLRRGRAEDVFEVIRQDPGIDVSTLADRVGISKPYASKLVSRLVDAGLVDKVREGQRSTLYANEV